MAYWVLSDEDLAEMMERAHMGEEPGVVIAEFYANSEVEQHG